VVSHHKGLTSTKRGSKVILSAYLTDKSYTRRSEDGNT